MSKPIERLIDFVNYVRTLDGDEKGEAQVFCDRLFKAFGHEGYKEAGATLEFRISKAGGKGKKFADLLWRPRLLLEMKKRGEKLQNHYGQAFEYWLHLVPHRPKYVVLCNFDEFWVYDFDLQLEEPVDRVSLEQLPERFTALNFLFPDEREPQFDNNRVAVTRDAANIVAEVFNSLIERHQKTQEERSRAQRFVLQCVMALFAEDFDLLPAASFTELIKACIRGESSYDVFGGLFQQMNSKIPARGGRYKDVPYFNGGLFSKVEPIELIRAELWLLHKAADFNWSKVQPQVFGTLFQSSMGAEHRHALGAHFTSEADIQKVVIPTIVRPWRERIERANTVKELLSLRDQMLEYRVLDPACGSGNFLYVAYRELKRLEVELLDKLRAASKGRARELTRTSLVTTSQFYGLDVDSFAVELAKVTLSLAKELVIRETREALEQDQEALGLELEQPLPLDNLDENIVCADALFVPWPKVDAIIGNPPYQSKNKMQQEYGPAYVRRVRDAYPDVPGRADFCVYWYKRSHDELAPEGRAGLVGTNTIRQNYSREGGLDYIVGNGGTITDAVSSQVWSGDAAVHVSIVNWIKGEQDGMKILSRQVGDNRDSPWEMRQVERINSALSFGIDVTGAHVLEANSSSGACYQGQTHGHEGFLLDFTEAQTLMRDHTARTVVHPYLTADELIGNFAGLPKRYSIDLNHCDDLFAAMHYGAAFEHIQALVLPAMNEAARKEHETTGKKNGPRQSHANRWWKFWRGRGELLKKLETIPRYIVCGRITKRPIFEFIACNIHPNDALTVFPMPDDYSFGILQSGLHWAWFTSRCSTLTERFRYTSDSVFDSFPWPQAPTIAQVQIIADAAVMLRKLRQRVMTENNWSLRNLYRTLETPGKNLLRDAHSTLDAAVRAAYGMKPQDDVLEFLLGLNGELAQREKVGLPIIGPGLPAVVPNPEHFVTVDAVKMP